MTTVKLGKVIYRPRGKYSATETYDRLDTVTDGYSTYYSKQDGNKGHDLPGGETAAESNAWWGYIANADDIKKATAAANEETAKAKAINETVVAAEVEREAAEKSRETESAKAQTAEAARQSAEANRVLAENTRVTNEEDREAAEEKRVAAEKLRVTAEEKRVTEAAEATDAANAAAGKADTAATNANDAAASATKAQQSSDAAEQERVAAEKLRVTAETSRQKAEATREAASATAVANAEAATEKANAAAENAQTQADAAAVLNEAVAKNTAAIALIEEDWGQYEPLDPVAITTAESGKYVDTTGTVKTNASYRITAQFAMKKGLVYKIPVSAAVQSDVALCAEYTTEERDVVIEYSYTYDTDGTTVLKATADYDTSLVYTYNYDTDSEGNKTLKNITDKSGNVVDYLPQYRTVPASSYVPLFKALSSDKPKSGKYTVLAFNDCKAVLSLPVADSVTEIESGRYGVLFSLINNKEDKAVVKKLQEQVAQLQAEQAMFTGAGFKDAVYDTMQESDPVADGEYGNDNPADCYDFLLVDHTAEVSSNGGAPYSVLQRNNIFRYKNGGFAPTVSITEEEMTAATDTTYERSILLGETVVKTFAAGEEYDAEAVLEAVKAAIAAGTSALTDTLTMTSNEVSGQHVVMPWETTSQDMSIYIGNTKSLWLIDHQKGTSGKVHTAILRRNIMLDGIDPTDWELKPTGLTPSPVFTITNADGKVVTRCHFTTRTGMTNCAGDKGSGNFCDAFYNNGTYPRTLDCQQMNLMTWARNNNADATSPLPHAEGGYHALNAFTCAMEVEHKTKYLHNATLFGSGISSNDDCSTDARLLANGGVKFKKSTDTAWTYLRYYSTPQIYNASGATISHFSSVLNQERPKERTMESQMAMSWAAELGIAPNTEFTTPYGGTYRYENVDGSTTSPSSLMAVRCFKTMQFNIDAYNADKEATTFNVVCVLRFSLYNGFNLSGDIFRYCGGGAELVSTVTTSEQLVSGVSGIIPLTSYVMPDQSKWQRETSDHVDNLGTFGFDSIYRNMGEQMNGDGYYQDREGYSPLRTVKGGSLSTYMCAYQWSNNYFNTNTLNRRTRLALRFSAYAYRSYVSPRSLAAYNGCSSAARDFGGLAQVLLGDALQAQ